jgi:Domain of unknown function (DUF1937)
MKPLIYLASPYSHTSASIRQDRYEDALKCTSWLFNNGFWGYSPIVNGHNLINVKHGWEAWKEFDTEMVTRCNEVWILMIPGVFESKGVRVEIEIAKLQGKKIMTVREKWSYGVVVPDSGLKNYLVNDLANSEYAKTF